MRAVLVFCEGNHDIVYATRSLGAITGVQWLNQPISDLPTPFGSQTDPLFPKNLITESVVLRRLRERKLDGLKLMDAAHPRSPSFQVFLKHPKDDILYALLRSGGDGAVEASQKLIRELHSQLEFGVQVERIAAAYLFDADDEGVKVREDSFAMNHKTLLNGSPGPKHRCWVDGTSDGEHIPVGLFVFHDSTKNQGTLEDILAPMVSKEWPERWKDAGAYLAKNQRFNDPVYEKPAEALKAQICITGQFGFPGDPMTQVLRGRPKGKGGENGKGFRTPTSKRARIQRASSPSSTEFRGNSAFDPHLRKETISSAGITFRLRHRRLICGLDYKKSCETCRFWASTLAMAHPSSAEYARPPSGTQ